MSRDHSPSAGGSRSVGEMSIRALRKGDIDAIRVWRNGQLDILRQHKPITKAEQRRYFRKHVWPTTSMTNPPQILFAIERNSVLLGYGGLVNISWHDRRAEVSFLLDPKVESAAAEREVVFLGFLALIRDLAFGQLGLQRLFTETFAHRVNHISCLEKFGFGAEGLMKNHVLIDGQPTDSVIHGLLRDPRESQGRP